MQFPVVFLVTALPGSLRPPVLTARKGTPSFLVNLCSFRLSYTSASFFSKNTSRHEWWHGKRRASLGPRSGSCTYLQVPAGQNCPNGKGVFHAWHEESERRNCANFPTGEILASLSRTRLDPEVSHVMTAHEARQPPCGAAVGTAHGRPSQKGTRDPHNYGPSSHAPGLRDHVRRNTHVTTTVQVSTPNLYGKIRFYSTKF